MSASKPIILLSFDPAKLPRTISRSEWKDISRWLRTVQRRLSERLGQAATLKTQPASILPNARTFIGDH